MKRTPDSLHSLLRLALISSWLTVAAHADVISRNDTSTSPSGLQNIITIFQNDLGGVDNGVGGTFASGYRTITWDDVPDHLATTNFLPGDYYLNTTPKGVQLSAENADLMVSASGASGEPVRFGHVDPTYRDTFQAFTAERLFSPAGGQIVDLSFFMPGDPLQEAYITGFGAVFADVDIIGETSIELFDLAGTSLHTGYALPGPEGGLSFLGIYFNGGEQVGRVRITTGTDALSSGLLDGGAVDLVVMDNVYFSEPTAVPEPSALALCGLGLAGMMVFQWRRRR